MYKISLDIHTIKFSNKQTTEHLVISFDVNNCLGNKSPVLRDTATLETDFQYGEGSKLMHVGGQQETQVVAWDKQ